MADESDTSGALLPFDESTGSTGRIIRRQWHEERWFFSVVDVVAILTDSADPGAYWRKLKQRLLALEGASQSVTNLHALKMRAADGKSYKTDAADAETMLRIVQSVPSPKAEPIKQWLATVGNERLQEIADTNDVASMTEAQRRIFTRHQLAYRNQELATTAQAAGVLSNRDFAIFQDHGYRGLYAGETARDIATRKGLKRGQRILDWMSSEELAANLFRSTQTEAKLRRDGITDKDAANKAHHDIGKAVRRFILEDLGGTPPEQLPTPADSIEQVEARERKRLADARDRDARPSLFPDLDTRGKRDE